MVIDNNQKNIPASGSFILSCSRSGSSLLRYILDTHPDIASPAELKIGKLCKNLYYFVASTVGAASNINDPSEKNQLVLAKVREILSGVLDEYITVKNKRIWCEKSPQNLDDIEIIKAVFPDAKYICLYRHAMDTVHSLIEMTPPEQKKSEDIVSTMVKQWIDQTTKLLTYERNNSAQCFRIKYESYVINPTEALEPMFRFLGVPWDNSLLDQVFSVDHDIGLGDPKLIYSTQVHQNSLGKGAKISRSSIPEFLLNQMNMLLSELDYPLVGDDWDTAPSPYRTMGTTPTQGNTIISTVEEFFASYLPGRIKAWVDNVPDSKIIGKIVVTGNDSGIWIIDLTKPSNWISVGDGEANCTITLDSQTLIDVVNCKNNPMEAWMQHKMHIVGDMVQAEMLGLLVVEGSHKQNIADEFWWRDVAVEIAQGRSNM